jgi:hypothetical protein
MAQFTPFDVGQVKAHMHHGLGAQRISQIVTEADGKTKWTDTAVQDCMNKLLANPRWRLFLADNSQFGNLADPILGLAWPGPRLDD